MIGRLRTSFMQGVRMPSIIPLEDTKAWTRANESTGDRENYHRTRPSFEGGDTTHLGAFGRGIRRDPDRALSGQGPAAWAARTRRIRGALRQATTTVRRDCGRTDVRARVAKPRPRAARGTAFACRARGATRGSRLYRKTRTAEADG